jgi:hypothetical protein
MGLKKSDRSVIDDIDGILLALSKANGHARHFEHVPTARRSPRGELLLLRFKGAL